ncbi:hypothetical protein Agabi119p4_926 [Agaricus bisporus var. burnettii]|uniref:Bromodomain-containing protein n=1 Tax=Agaricus bisporus var. burnettii TaxID=192524 RepID=A0A8H7FBQ5_AGABI|nr:hypothetical protein Agabi119p4_926 [Agaricus bisporus var. burnettii]
MNHEHSVDSGHTDPITPDVPPAAGVNGAANGVTKLNGGLQRDASSPTLDSPATPVSNSAAPDVKIDDEFHEQEGDVRHEAIPIKPIAPVDSKPAVTTIDDASVDVHKDAVEDPAVIPVDPLLGTPPPQTGDSLEDINMDERTSVPNGVHHDADVHMDDGNVPPPTSPPTMDGSLVDIDVSGTSILSQADEEEHKPPPAKRARMHSDADQASLAHSATPPPASTAPSPLPPPSATTTTSVPPSSAPLPPPSTPSGPSTLTSAQLRFCQSTVRSLKKIKDAAPFLRPVDPVALNIPHYFTIIKQPMDLSTVERKLASSNPQKPDPNSENPRYNHADEFVADVRLMFYNCLTFNGPDHAVTAMGKRVEEIFDKQIKHMPPAMPPPEIKPPPPPKKPTPPPPQPAPAPPKQQKVPPARRLSTTMPVIRRNDNEAVGRPKREIHPPPSKDLPYVDAPKKHRKSKRVKDDGTAEQLKYCGKILSDLNRKQHYNVASPFYEPVDWVKMDLPMYPKVVKKPMDLSTMRRKLDNNEYAAAKDFYSDFKLMIKNCFTFNPVGTPVQIAGADLQRLFEEKWKSLPPLREISDSEDEEDSEDDDRQRQIADIEQKMEMLQNTLTSLKSKPAKKKKEERREKAPVASTSKAPTKQSKSQPSKKKNKKPIADDDVLTFEQKKDLSESIGKLDGTKLEKVIQIIHEGVPEIRDSTEEIELEIDTLPAAVLTKLYNFVIRPMRAQPSKRNRPGKGTGTGGLKRKSMDEDVEAEKIRQLEQRMALFEQPAGSGLATTTRNVDSDHSSDSSDSDSSGSDSE